MDIHYIESALIQLDYLYQKQDNELDSKHIIKQELLSKIAALELCGWLEDTHDALIQKYLDRCTQSPFSKKNIFKTWENQVKKALKDTHGLSYDKHFRSLLSVTLGNITILQLENEIGFLEIEEFTNILNTLHTYRSELAHKSYYNIKQQKTLDTPEVILKKFKYLHKILEKFEYYLENMSIQFHNESLK